MMCVFLILLTTLIVANTAENFYWYRSSGTDGSSIVVNAFPITQKNIEPDDEYPEIGSNDPDFKGDWLMQLLITPVGLHAVFATSTLSGKNGFAIQGNILA